MKKTLFLSLLITTALLSANYSYALQPKSSDYEIVTTKQENLVDTEQMEVYIQLPSGKQFVKIDDKYALYSPELNKLLINPIIISVTPLTNSNTEFKIKGKASTKTSYYNDATNTFFVHDCDDLSLLNKYIKIKKDNKFGLIDKNGDIILQPVFQAISVLESGDNEYLSAKYEGKTRIFKNTGELIPDNELYTISYDKYYTLANDLKPVFKASYKDMNTTLYEKAEFSANVYEIQELAIPHKVKVSSLSKQLPSAEVIDNSDTINIDGKDYILVHKDDRVGLNTLKNKEIVPAVFSKIDLKQPCEHFKHKVVIATHNDNTTIYDLKGNILAQGTKNTLHIYRYGRTYTYTNDGNPNKWVLTLNEKQIGTLNIISNKYEFIKTAFHFRSLHKINELLLSVIS